jgi:hypothetical protein
MRRHGTVHAAGAVAELRSSHETSPEAVRSVYGGSGCHNPMSCENAILARKCGPLAGEIKPSRRRAVVRPGAPVSLTAGSGPRLRRHCPAAQHSRLTRVRAPTGLPRSTPCDRRTPHQGGRHGECGGAPPQRSCLEPKQCNWGGRSCAWGQSAGGLLFSSGPNPLFG